MLVKVFRQLTATGRPCVISVREPLAPELSRSIPAPTVSDTHADAGPLGGLASAAAHVRTPLLFAAAGDLPNIDCALIDELERQYRQAATGAAAPEVVLPRHENGDVEPLAALYDTAALRDSAQRCLALGRKKVTQALEGLRVIHYDIPAERASTFININTDADLTGIRPS